MPGVNQHQVVTGRVGNTDGRVVEVARSPFYIHLYDPVTPHTGWVFHGEQARELAEALLRAVER